jgi:bleomycin hydrolase
LILKMSASDSFLTPEQIRGFRDAFASDPTAKLMQNAVVAVGAKDISVNWEVIQNTDLAFSTKLDDWTVTDQASSGRCWLFAALNLLRPGAMKKMKVKSFEFSQAHIHFWDKMERSNYFLQSMVELIDRDVDDRTVAYMLGDPIGDGGQWNMAVALISKHGLVPKQAYPESQSSSATLLMNAQLKEILRTSACELRALKASGKSMVEIMAHKDKRVADIWRMLCIHLGTPPESFDWQYMDKDSKLQRTGVITPQQFVAEYVDLPYQEYVCLVNDPRNEMFKTYTVDRLQNVYGGPPVVYLNVPVQCIKDATRRTLVELGVPVWMGCDVGKQFDRVRGLWDEDIRDHSKVYGVDSYKMNKADRLLFRQTLMTHAMLFTGVDVRGEGVGVGEGEGATTAAATATATAPQTIKWRVENSWGSKNADKGFCTMNDNWFDEHMFEVACDRSLLSAEMTAALELAPIVLPAWDPMGSLATEEGAGFD